MILQEAFEEILACPSCKGRVVCSENGRGDLLCAKCQRRYPTVEGIPVFIGTQRSDQDDERRFRDALAVKYLKSGRRTLLDVIARHHCIPIMRSGAQIFRSRFKADQWILDLGTGWGWHWSAGGSGARIVALDMSLGNLRLARRLLSEKEDVALVCADASALPLREKSISGVWSVQAFQHFPEGVLRQVRSELDRVLHDEFEMEIYNLNPAWLHRAVYCLFGKKFHCHGKDGNMELNRLSATEWTSAWREFRAGRSQISYGYSELFFHPNFHLRPRPYPLRLERALVRYAPKLAAAFARQVQIRVEAKVVGHGRDAH